MDTPRQTKPEDSISGISRHWQIIAGVLVAAIAVGGYVERQKDHDAELQNFKTQTEERFKSLETKQENKFKSEEEIEQRVDDLEEYRAFEEGYRQALKDINNEKKPRLP